MMMTGLSGPSRDLKAGYGLKARHGPYMLSLGAILYRGLLIAILPIIGSLLGFFSYSGSPYSFRSRSVIWPEKASRYGTLSTLKMFAARCVEQQHCATALGRFLGVFCGVGQGLAVARLESQKGTGICRITNIMPTHAGFAPA